MAETKTLGNSGRNPRVKLQKLLTPKDRMEYLLLHLSGDVFTVWSQLEDDEKEDEARARECLKLAFTLSCGQAYAQFVLRRKRVNETADAYLSDLR